MGGKKRSENRWYILNPNQITSNGFNHIGLNLDTTFDGKIENVVMIEIYIKVQCFAQILHKLPTDCLRSVVKNNLLLQ